MKKITLIVSDDILGYTIISFLEKSKKINHLNIIISKPGEINQKLKQIQDLDTKIIIIGMKLDNPYRKVTIINNIDNPPSEKIDFIKVDNILLNTFKFLSSILDIKDEILNKDILYYISLYIDIIREIVIFDKSNENHINSLFINDLFWKNKQNFNELIINDKINELVTELIQIKNEYKQYLEYIKLNKLLVQDGDVVIYFGNKFFSTIKYLEYQDKTLIVSNKYNVVRIFAKNEYIGDKLSQLNPILSIGKYNAFIFDNEKQTYENSIKFANFIQSLD